MQSSNRKVLSTRRFTTLWNVLCNYSKFAPTTVTAMADIAR